MAILRALKPFVDMWSGKQRVKDELFRLDDVDEAQRLIEEGYAMISGDQEPDVTKIPEEE